MITALDSSVLWSLLKNESTAVAWKEALMRASSDGPLVICPIAFAELAPSAADLAALNDVLQRLEIRFDPISPEAAFLAGTTFRQYRQAGGPRQHLVPDFVIGAHAQTQADRLAAIDRGYLRRWFPGLALLRPAAG